MKPYLSRDEYLRRKNYSVIKRRKKEIPEQAGHCRFTGDVTDSGSLIRAVFILTLVEHEIDNS